MPLETGTYIDSLVATNPETTDPLSQADDHLQLIKSTLKATFPYLTGAISDSHTTINTHMSTVGAATDANTVSTLVKRDASGNFIAGNITAAITGNVTGDVTGDVTGNLTGDVTGTSTKWGGYNISTDESGTDANTIYFRT